jgi:hypothetical protein
MVKEERQKVFDIPAAEPSSKQLAVECSGAAENSVEWIKSMSGIELDFTPPSLMALDRVLEVLIPSLSRDDEDTAVVMLGSYLGEVFLRTCGGRWETGDVFAGPGLRGLGGKEITINPFSQIRQAFEKLEPHHLAGYWNVVVERIENAKPIEDRSGFRPQPEDRIRMLPVVTAKVAAKAKGPSDEELARLIPEETRKFVQILRNDIGVELDFSIDSLRFLDHYLKSISEIVRKEGKMGERRVFVYLAGNYLGEVIRRAYGGRWVYLAEEETAGLIIREGQEGGMIFPHKAAAKLAFEYDSGGVVIYADRIKKRLGITGK